MKVIRFLLILNCVYWIPLLIASEYHIGWSMGFELGLSVVIVLVAHVGSPLEGSIIMLLGLALGNSFVKW